MTLRAALPAEGGLDEEEMDTLREVEERLESNKVQLEYKDRKIDSIQQEVNAWAERRRRMKRRDATGGATAAAGGEKDGGKEGQGAAAGKSRPEVGEAQMIEELESGVSDLKGAKGIIRVLFSSLVASRRGLKQKTGVAKGFQVCEARWLAGGEGAGKGGRWACAFFVCRLEGQMFVQREREDAVVRAVGFCRARVFFFSLLVLLFVRVSRGSGGRGGRSASMNTRGATASSSLVCSAHECQPSSRRSTVSTVHTCTIRRSNTVSSYARRETDRQTDARLYIYI